MIQKRVVLIADRVNNHQNATLEMNNLEVLDDDYFIPLYQTLKNISPSVVHYESPAEFTEQICIHKEDIVLSVWSGTGSRSRRALVPAICEANKIAYVGADSFLQALCQDKDLSKSFAKKYGINSPKGILIYSSNDFHKLDLLTYPIIIKPNYEGGSIGIFNCSVVQNANEASSLAKRLLYTYSPLLAEEYILGEEISFCLAGTRSQLSLFEVIRQYINGRKFFHHEIMGAEYKKISEDPQLWDNVTSSICPDLKKLITDFYFHLGKAELIRIDGRINEAGFFLIELSTDVGLSRKSTMTQAFESAGKTYEEMLEQIISNSIQSSECQNANML